MSKTDKITNVLTSIMGFIGFFAGIYLGKDDLMYASFVCCISVLLVIYKSKAWAKIKNFNK